MNKHKFLTSFIAVSLALALVFPGAEPALAAAPINDNFSQAMVITSLPFRDSQDTSEATVEENDPQSPCWGGDATIWYAYTSPVNQPMLVAYGTSYWSVAAVYTLDGSGNWNNIACRNQWDNPRINFLADAGVTYYIVLGRIGTTYPPYYQATVTVFSGLTPLNDNFSEAQPLDSSPYHGLQDIASATLESSEPTPSCGQNQPPDRSVWYQYITGQTGAVRTLINGPDWFYVGVWTGNDLANLTELGCAWKDTSLTVPVQSGQVVYLQFANPTPGNGEILEFQFDFIPPPANDNFINAKEVTSNPFDENTESISATTEDGEIYPTCVSPSWSPGRTFWYSFTPEMDGYLRTYTISPYEESFLGVYTADGVGFNNLHQVGCASRYEVAGLRVAANTTYYLQAGTLWGATRMVSFHLEERPIPANDDFTNATVFYGLSFSEEADLTPASYEPNEPSPDCYPNENGNSVWYSFTPSQDTWVTAKTAPSGGWESYKLGIYTGSSVNQLARVAGRCNGEPLTVFLQGGVTYYFQVSDKWGSGGKVIFSLQPPPPPTASYSTNSYYEPSVFDTIEFSDYSSDPAGIGFTSYAWDFGDGSTATGAIASHSYSADGDYTVTHTVTTADGRSATVAGVMQVRTHDLSIVKLTVPSSARAGQAKAITVSIKNTHYPERGRMQLLVSKVYGYAVVDEIYRDIPVKSGGRATDITFQYTFTQEDARLGKVTFMVVVETMMNRDAYGADNTAASLPVKVSR